MIMIAEDNPYVKNWWGERERERGREGREGGREGEREVGIDKFK